MSTKVTVQGVTAFVVAVVVAGALHLLGVALDDAAINVVGGIAGWLVAWGFAWLAPETNPAPSSLEHPPEPPAR